MKKIPGGKHFAKKFGNACGDFNIFNNEGLDHFLLPLDLDYADQTLLYWVHYKTTKIPKHFQVTTVHFHSSDTPNEHTISALSELCQKLSVPFKIKKVDQPENKNQYLQILVQTASEYGCNKIAIPDSLDFLNAFLLTNMAKSGIFSGASITQEMHLTPDPTSPTVLLTRPFCYVGDDDIEKFAKECEFENNPTGITVAEDPYMATARQGIKGLISDFSNVRMNFFHSQFSIQKKYMGIGEDKVLGDIGE